MRWPRPVERGIAGGGSAGRSARTCSGQFSLRSTSTYGVFRARTRTRRTRMSTRTLPLSTHEILVAVRWKESALALAAVSIRGPGTRHRSLLSLLAFQVAL